MRRLARLLLTLSSVSLVTTILIASTGLARNVWYPNVPHWFSAGMNFCFYLSLVLMFMSVCLIFSKPARTLSSLSAALALTTASLVAWIVTGG